MQPGRALQQTRPGMQQHGSRWDESPSFGAGYSSPGWKRAQASGYRGSHPGRQAVIEECVGKAAEKDRKEVEKEIKRAVDTFKPDQMRAGAEVFRALAEEGQFSGKKLYFARTGMFAWLLAYVNEKGTNR